VDCGTFWGGEYGEEVGGGEDDGGLVEVFGFDGEEVGDDVACIV